MKLVMAYELPLVLAVCVPIVQCQAALTWARSCRRRRPITRPRRSARAAGGAGRDAGQDGASRRSTWARRRRNSAAGVLIEYSGPPLAMFKLSQAVMLLTGPLFLLVLFCGGIPLGARLGSAPAGGVGRTAGAGDFAVSPDSQHRAAGAGGSGDAECCGGRSRLAAVAGAAAGLDGGEQMSIAKRSSEPVAVPVPSGRQRLQQLRHRNPRRADAQVRPGAVRRDAGRQHPPRGRDSAVGSVQQEGRGPRRGGCTSRRPSP